MSTIVRIPIYSRGARNAIYSAVAKLKAVIRTDCVTYAIELGLLGFNSGSLAHRAAQAGGAQPPATSSGSTITYGTEPAAYYLTLHAHADQLPTIELAIEFAWQSFEGQLDARFAQALRIGLEGVLFDSEPLAGTAIGVQPTSNQGSCS